MHVQHLAVPSNLSALRVRINRENSVQTFFFSVPTLCFFALAGFPVSVRGLARPPLGKGVLARGFPRLIADRFISLGILRYLELR